MMPENRDEALIDHIAERLYTYRFSDPGFGRCMSWGDCKLKDPTFAACYLDSAAVALKAQREYRAQ